MYTHRLQDLTFPFPINGFGCDVYIFTHTAVSELHVIGILYYTTIKTVNIIFLENNMKGEGALLYSYLYRCLGAL